jgi:tight adherence protein B
MNPYPVLFFVFAAVALLVVGVSSLIAGLVQRDRTRMGQRVDEEFRKRQREKVSRSLLFKDLSPEAIAAAQEEPRRNLQQWFTTLLEQSGLSITPQKLLIIMGAVGMGAGALAGLLRQGVLPMIIALVIGTCIPLWYVAHKRKVRMDKLASQLPDAFDLMSRVLRAGQTMSQALLAVADEFDQPIAAEFSYCFEQQNLGMAPEQSLRDLAKRTGLLEIKVFVVAVVVQQQTGGNIAELLDKLANIVRERFRIAGRIRSLTAEGRMQATVLLALPPALLILLFFLNRKYTEVLLAQPALLVAMFIMEAIGALWIRRIVNFDY